VIKLTLVMAVEPYVLITPAAVFPVIDPGLYKPGEEGFFSNEIQAAWNAGARSFVTAAGLQRGVYVKESPAHIQDLLWALRHEPSYRRGRR